MFNTGILFKENYDAWWKPEDEFQGQAKIVINQGGTESSKTYSIMQVITYIATTHPIPTGGNIPLITVLNSTVPNARKGSYRIFEELVKNPHVSSRIIHWDRGNRTIKFSTGWILEFVSAISEQDAKNGKREYLFVNEANGIPWLIFWQMAKRTRIRVWIDYNPTARFWAHDKLITCPYPDANDLYSKVRVIISDHRHNPFLTEEQHTQTENIKDPELWRVYARGLTGNMEGIIYPDWTMIPLKDFPVDGVRFGAVDFGYTNDPTAGVIIRKKKRDIFVQEICYRTGIPDREVYELFRKQHKFSDETPVYCERDLATIREFKLMGMNALAAEKGSVTRGIHKMKKGFKFYYTSNSKNLHNELTRYQWLKDEDTGELTNEPIDAYNHLLDAVRYGVLTHSLRNLIAV